MSAFVIDAEHMSRVLLGIFSRDTCGQNVPQFFGRYTSAGDRLSWDPTELGRLLFRLNIDAVTQRYPDCRDAPDNLPGPAGAGDLADTFRFARANVGRQLTTEQLVGCYKAMRSLLYQCSEGNAPEQPLYQELERAAGDIADAIVRRLPAYQTARW